MSARKSKTHDRKAKAQKLNGIDTHQEMDPKLLKAYRAKHWREQCHQVATDQAKADPSDPHVFNRVMSHLVNGRALPSDYQVEFRKEERTTLGENPSAYTVDVPFSMTRP